MGNKMVWDVVGTVGCPGYKETLARGVSLDEATELWAQARGEKGPDGRFRYSTVGKHPRTVWEFEPGDRVRYTVDWVRNTGQVTSNNPRVHSTATVVSVKGSIVEVQWDCDLVGETTKVLAANLGPPRTTATCAC
jgi:hypothetical protein